MCRALFALNVLYCTLALFEDRLPAWKMFESGERLDYRLTDGAGRVVDVSGYLPQGAYVLALHDLTRVVEWICRREPGRAPFHLEERHRGMSVDLSPPACEVP